MKKKEKHEPKLNRRTFLTNKRQEKVNKRKPNVNKKVASSKKYKIKTTKKTYTQAEKNRMRKRTLIMIAAIIAIVVICFMVARIFLKIRNNNIFAQSAEKLQQEYENPIFKIEEILIYSGANVEDTSKNKNLANVNISQFTDFAIYIDNQVTTEELTEENTVNNIYISDIAVTMANYGTQKVYYKDIDDICIYKSIANGTDRINYTVLHTLAEKEKNSKSNVFYTDCTDPLVLSYVNENVVEGENLSEAEEVFSLDGSLLEYLGIALEDLNYTLSFTIYIENNLGDLYKCDCSIDVDLSSDDGGLYTGYIMQIYDLTENNYTFRKVQ